MRTAIVFVALTVALSVQAWEPLAVRDRGTLTKSGSTLAVRRDQPGDLPYHCSWVDVFGNETVYAFLFDNPPAGGALKAICIDSLAFSELDAPCLVGTVAADTMLTVRIDIAPAHRTDRLSAFEDWGVSPAASAYFYVPAVGEHYRTLFAHGERSSPDWAAFVRFLNEDVATNAGVVIRIRHSLFQTVNIRHDRLQLWYTLEDEDPGTLIDNDFSAQYVPPGELPSVRGLVVVGLARRLMGQNGMFIFEAGTTGGSLRRRGVLLPFSEEQTAGVCRFLIGGLTESYLNITLHALPADSSTAMDTLTLSWRP